MQGMYKRIIFCTLGFGIFLFNGCLPFGDEDVFVEEPEIIEALSPYFDKWATTPPEETREERRQKAAELRRGVFIELVNPRNSLSGDTYYLVRIRLDAWADWSRGYYYVLDGSDLTQDMGLGEIRRVSDKLYLYSLFQ